MEKARPAAIEDRLAVRDLPHHLDEIGDAIRAIGEDVREFARHGDGMHGIRWAERKCLGERGIELARVLPERAGDLRYRDGATPVDAGKLEIGAAEVPADYRNHSVHNPSRWCLTPMRSGFPGQAGRCAHSPDGR
jgi:hypothetical protein